MLTKVSDACKDIGKPGLGIDVIQPCGRDKGEHDGCPVSAAGWTGILQADAYGWLQRPLSVSESGP